MEGRHRQVPVATPPPGSLSGGLEAALPLPAPGSPGFPGSGLHGPHRLHLTPFFLLVQEQVMTPSSVVKNLPFSKYIAHYSREFGVGRTTGTYATFQLDLD